MRSVIGRILPIILACAHFGISTDDIVPLSSDEIEEYDTEAGVNLPTISDYYYIYVSGPKDLNKFIKHLDGTYKILKADNIWYLNKIRKIGYVLKIPVLKGKETYFKKLLEKYGMPIMPEQMPKTLYQYKTGVDSSQISPSSVNFWAPKIGSPRIPRIRNSFMASTKLQLPRFRRPIMDHFRPKSRPPFSPNFSLIPRNRLNFRPRNTFRGMPRFPGSGSFSHFGLSTTSPRNHMSRFIPGLGYPSRRWPSFTPKNRLASSSKPWYTKIHSTRLTTIKPATLFGLTSLLPFATKIKSHRTKIRTTHSHPLRSRFSTTTAMMPFSWGKHPRRSTRLTTKHFLGAGFRTTPKAFSTVTPGYTDGQNHFGEKTTSAYSLGDVPNEHSTFHLTKDSHDDPESLSIETRRSFLRGLNFNLRSTTLAPGTTFMDRIKNKFRLNKVGTTTMLDGETFSTPSSTNTNTELDLTTSHMFDTTPSSDSTISTDGVSTHTDIIHSMSTTPMIVSNSDQCRFSLAEVTSLINKIIADKQLAKSNDPDYIPEIISDAEVESYSGNALSESPKSMRKNLLPEFNTEAPVQTVITTIKPPETTVTAEIVKEVSGQELSTEITTELPGVTKKESAASKLLAAIKKDHPRSKLLAAIKKDKPNSNLVAAVKKDPPGSKLLAAIKKDPPGSKLIAAIKKKSPVTKITGLTTHIVTTQAGVTTPMPLTAQTTETVVVPTTIIPTTMDGKTPGLDLRPLQKPGLFDNIFSIFKDSDKVANLSFKKIAERSQQNAASGDYLEELNN